MIRNIIIIFGTHHSCCGNRQLIINCVVTVMGWPRTHQTTSIFLPKLCFHLCITVWSFTMFVALQRAVSACFYAANWINCWAVIVRPSFTFVTAFKRKHRCRTCKPCASTTCLSVMRKSFTQFKLKPSDLQPFSLTVRYHLLLLLLLLWFVQYATELAGRCPVRPVFVFRFHLLASAKPIHVLVLHANAPESSSSTSTFVFERFASIVVRGRYVPF